MTKNLYYRTMLRRENVVRSFIFGLFSIVVSYPRLLLEVFIRRNFGERYFRLSSAWTVVVILAFWPYYASFFSDDEDSVNSSFASHYLTLYIFLGLFLLFSLKRYIEIRRNPSVYDFAKFSLYSGQINPAFLNFQVSGKKINRRLIETVLEPAPFFIAGVFLWLLHQKLGIVLTVCSVCYSISYMAAYNAGDNFIMDKIDEMICNEELEKAFVSDEDGEETRGFRFMGRKPNDTDVRRKLLPLMTQEEEVVEAF